MTSKLLSAHPWQGMETKDPCRASHSRALRLSGPLDRDNTRSNRAPLLQRHDLLVVRRQLHFNQMEGHP